jgi:hypothetical protein
MEHIKPEVVLILHFRNQFRNLPYSPKHLERTENGLLILERLQLSCWQGWRIVAKITFKNPLFVACVQGSVNTFSVISIKQYYRRGDGFVFNFWTNK